jgi:hypothetical protein
MKHHAILGLLLPLAVSGAASADPDPDVWEYAKSCYERLHLDPDDLAGRFDCTQGKRLVSTVDGVVQDLDMCQGASCAKTIPAECDYGTWLDDNCYGHSYVQVLATPSNPKVKAALLCRHKTRWGLGPAPLLDLNGDLITGFDDIAMIVHNSGNGETCWFQSPDGEDAHMDGSSVPGPHTVRDHDYWIRPTSTRDIMCIKCHDSGPWMNSRWMNNVIGSELAGNMADPLKGPYFNSEPPFDKWPEPKFAELADDDTCTSCHHIAAARRNIDEDDSIGGPHFKTCREWIERATGAEVHPNASATGRTFAVTHWMPEGHGLTSETEWENTYRSKVNAIVDCCTAVGTKPANQWPEGCQEEIAPRTCPVPEAADGSCPVAVTP